MRARQTTTQSEALAPRILNGIKDAKSTGTSPVTATATAAAIRSAPKAVFNANSHPPIRCDTCEDCAMRLANRVDLWETRP